MPTSLIARAFAGLPLAPIERSVLRLAEGLGATALVAAAPIVAQALNHPTAINYNGTITAAIGAASTAVLLALLKYVSAKGDGNLESGAATSAPLPGPLPAAAALSGQQTATVAPAEALVPDPILPSVAPTVPAIPADAQPVQTGGTTA